EAEASFYAGYNHCNVEYLRQAGVPVTFIKLAEIGIHGNGHMMMLEKNSDQVAQVIADWLDKAMPVRWGAPAIASAQPPLMCAAGMTRPYSSSCVRMCAA